MALLTSVLKDDIDFHAKYWNIKQYYCIKYYTSLLDQYQTRKPRETYCMPEWCGL